MINLHVFSRPSGFLLFKDYALGVVIARSKEMAESKAFEEDCAAFRIGLSNFTDRHKKRAKDIFLVIDDDAAAGPYVLSVLRKLFGDPEMAVRLARLNCKVECPKMNAAAAQALTRRILDRDF
ncbi:hypothetical protein [Uliginosibacterium sp. H1]|uniref:hypothetical protein n=1 Tax=Uliginosibacterium sp. H1 TaxID=3114757 RepID=UPI002E172BD5|nr:hypothetical protein [Uliginosibacterium sp. H1]